MPLISLTEETIRGVREDRQRAESLGITDELVSAYYDAVKANGRDGLDAAWNEVNSKLPTLSPEDSAFLRDWLETGADAYLPW